ncbi:MAG: serine/threonine-protein kinase [Pseudomonadota bacterium]
MAIQPQMIGRYRVSRKLGEGGMAEVYLAFLEAEGGFSQKIVLKRLKGSGEELSQMLNEEARLLTKLRHPNIVGVYDLAKDQISPYIVMEYVEGVDLGRLFYCLKDKGEKLPQKFALHIVNKILEALNYAHNLKDEDGSSLDVVHRDISPPNVLLSNAGAVKLADFGIARGKHRETQTVTGHLKGRFSYMSPEQVRSQLLDARSDLFSVGIILYELLTGERLFEGDSDYEVLQSVERAQISEDALNDLPARLKSIVMKSLDGDKEKRYQTALSFLEDIDIFVRENSLSIISHQLGEFLLQNFPRGDDRELPTADVTKATRILPEKKSPKFKHLIFLIPILIIFYFLWGDTIREKIAVEAPVEKIEVPVEKVTPPPQVEKKPLPSAVIEKRETSKISEPLSKFGEIVINSNPTGATCLLTINGEPRRFILPMVLSDIDLSKRVDVKYAITKDEYNPIAGSFALSRSKPTFKKTFMLVSPAKGTISVNAQPWGYVSIEGVTSNSETPFGPVEVTSGEYVVQVSYPPLDKVLTHRAVVENGQKLRCMAKFTDVSTISCF